VSLGGARGPTGTGATGPRSNKRLLLSLVDGVGRVLRVRWTSSGRSRSASR
jgi:hypothetical protein